MKIINIAIFVFLFVIQVNSLPSGEKSETPVEEVKTNFQELPLASAASPQPIPIQNTSTTIDPPTNETTSITPSTSSSTTTSSTPSTTTSASNTTSPSPSPSPSPSSPNVTTSAPNTSTLLPNTTLAPSTSTVAPHSHTQRFDFPSFIGGIMLTLGLLAIGFVSHKFYKARTDRNYHTL